MNARIMSKDGLDDLRDGTKIRIYPTCQLEREALYHLVEQKGRKRFKSRIPVSDAAVTRDTKTCEYLDIGPFKPVRIKKKIKIWTTGGRDAL